MGVFFSAFDNQGKLLLSHGVLETDKTLDSLLDLFYNGMLKNIEPNISGIVFDFVMNLTSQQDINAFLQMSPKDTWVVLTSVQDGKSWVLLPDTQWVTTMQQAIACIKQKYQLVGNGTIATFKTTKITFHK